MTDTPQATAWTRCPSCGEDDMPVRDSMIRCNNEACRSVTPYARAGRADLIHTPEVEITQLRERLVMVNGYADRWCARFQSSQDALNRTRDQRDTARREVHRLNAELDENERLRDRLAGLLRDTANALKGEPGPLESHDWSDLPKVAADIVAERDRLLLTQECGCEAHGEHKDCDDGCSAYACEVTR